LGAEGTVLECEAARSPGDAIRKLGSYMPTGQKSLGLLPLEEVAKTADCRGRQFLYLSRNR
jgi:hypothetical protein